MSRRHKVAAALTRFLEANQQQARARRLRSLENELERKLAAAFTEQGRRFLRSLSALEGRFAESVSGSDWLPLWASIALSSGSAFERVLADAILAALVAGSSDVTDDIDAPGASFGVSFTLENPRAAAYARKQAARQVTRINATTRDYLRTIITQAVEGGWSYDRTAEAITARFAEFSQDRARRIAVYEIGDAYEYGTNQTARGLAAAGLEMEKSWLTAGDSKVRPSHRANAAQGWIDLEDDFSSGDARPPTDPGCRCVTLHRRKPQ